MLESVNRNARAHIQITDRSLLGDSEKLPNKRAGFYLAIYLLNSYCFCFAVFCVVCFSFSVWSVFLICVLSCTYQRVPK